MQNMNAKCKAKKPKAIIQKGLGKKLQSAERKNLLICVSRLNPSITEVDAQGSIVDAFVNDDDAHINAMHVNCSKLDTKNNLSFISQKCDSRCKYFRACSWGVKLCL